MRLHKNPKFLRKQTEKRAFEKNLNKKKKKIE